MPEKLGLVLQPVGIGVRQQMNAPVVTQRHQLAVLPIAQVIDVPQLQRQLINRKSRHQHLQRWRVFHGFECVPFRARRQGMQRHCLGQQRLLHAAAFVLAQRAVVDQHFRNRAFKKSLCERRLRGII